MRRVRRTLIFGLLGVFAGSCGGGLLRDRDAAVEDGGGGDGAAGGSCPLAGEWRIERVFCGAQDVTVEYLARVPSTSLSLTASEDGCAGVLSLRADALFCSETETFTAEVLASSWNVVSNGVTECLFEGCTFGFEDEPCQIGDRAGRRTENLTIRTRTFTVTSFNGAVCPENVAQVTTWLKP
jgi:hypothetical protein